MRARASSTKQRPAVTAPWPAGASKGSHARPAGARGASSRGQPRGGLAHPLAPLALTSRRSQHRPRPPLPDLPRQRLQGRRLPRAPPDTPGLLSLARARPLKFAPPQRGGHGPSPAIVGASEAKRPSPPADPGPGAENANCDRGPGWAWPGAETGQPRVRPRGRRKRSPPCPILADAYWLGATPDTKTRNARDPHRRQRSGSRISGVSACRPARTFRSRSRT
jgi:hypothetical protein